MPTDLARHIAQLRVVDTHEHMSKEDDWINRGPADVLQDLFTFYDRNDLVSAGTRPPVLEEALAGGGRDMADRWKDLAPSWEMMKLTGYGEAVRIHAREMYGIEELTARAIRDAQPKLDAYRKPGERLRLLRDVAKLDHIQTDDFCWPCLPDASGPEFFFYDIRWVDFAKGEIAFDALAGETGITVDSLASLRRAFEALVARYAPFAVALKTQHAYGRTLRWVERGDTDAAAALARVLREPKTTDEATRLCLGDWCLARGCELAVAHNLPIKIHTGYYAGNGYMLTERINAGLLCDLIIRHPSTRFVLMHIAYPYGAELIAIAKHFANVTVDLCWAWSIDPYTSMDFVRRFIHAVPINKLFAYGGDTFSPTRGVAFASQMRRWITRALEAEVAAGDLSEREAIAVADRLLRMNQLDVFDMEAKRRAVSEATVATK